jgi:thymidylate synthase
MPDCRTLNQEWLNTLRLIVHHGQPVSPRNYETYEHLQQTVTIEMQYCVLTHPERALSYQFMAAEAYWILTGNDRVDGIAPWNKYIEKFSDNGETFFGAYGPKIISQLDYVVDKLKHDPWSRQAGLTLWRENPPFGKDIPCTVAIFAMIRERRLNLHVFMRSSDVWLGLPYDVFNFSMLANLICCRLNTGPELSRLGGVAPGLLYLTAASMHLYQANADAANVVLFDARVHREGPPVPPDFSHSETILLNTLAQLRGTKKGSPLRWWEVRA